MLSALIILDHICAPVSPDTPVMAHIVQVTPRNFETWFHREMRSRWQRGHRHCHRYLHHHHHHDNHDDRDSTLHIWISGSLSLLVSHLFWKCIKPYISDIDECLDAGVDLLCGSNAVCSNQPGSYQCTCDTGYSGDGVNCTGTKYLLFNLFNGRLESGSILKINYL